MLLWLPSTSEKMLQFKFYSYYIQTDAKVIEHTLSILVTGFPNLIRLIFVAEEDTKINTLQLIITGTI